MKKEFSKLAKVYSNNAVLPILESVKIDSQFITITNLEVYYSLKHNWEVSNTVFIDFKQLKEIVDKKTICKIENNKEFAIITTIEGREFKFNSAYDPTDWPEVESEGITYEIDLNDQFKTAQNFISNDKLRLALNCVCFKDGYICATDAHTLYYDKTNLDKNLNILFPKSVFFLDGKYQLTIGEKRPHQTVFNKLISENEIIYFANVEAKYPDFLSVIPENNENLLIVDKKEITSIINDALICANKITNRINFNGSVSSEDLDLQKSFKSQYKKQVMGYQEPNLFFNGKFLLNILKHIKDNEIMLRYQDRKGVIINKNFLIMQN
jgi:DNA polymerase-3 subunit beta